jgi:hypothetical protein
MLDLGFPPRPRGRCVPRFREALPHASLCSKTSLPRAPLRELPLHHEAEGLPFFLFPNSPSFANAAPSRPPPSCCSFWKSLFLEVLVSGSPCFWGTHTHLGTHAPRHTRTSAHTHPGTHAPRHTRTPAHTHLGTHAPRHASNRKERCRANASMAHIACRPSEPDESSICQGALPRADEADDRKLNRRLRG